jgi:alpha-galactosidase
MHAQHSQHIPLSKAKFSLGDTASWSSKNFDDAAWKELKTNEVWQTQGFPDYHGFAWYRLHFFLSSSLKKNAFWKDSLRIFLAHVNDVDDTYLNGQKIGKTGSFPEDAGGYVTKWPAVRQYHLAINNEAIHWDADNVIAIRVFDGGGTGGLFMGEPYIDMLEKTDGIDIKLNAGEINYIGTEKAVTKLRVKNNFNTNITGILKCDIYDAGLAKNIATRTNPISLNAFTDTVFTIEVPNRENIHFNYTFTEDKTNMSIAGKHTLPYILTPSAPLQPRINSAKIYGATPGFPFLFKIAATGKKPLVYSVNNLPKGLLFDKKTGVISGTTPTAGNYQLSITVSNTLGKAIQTFTIAAGENKIALTPPMGWNSWNCWGLSVSDEKVRSSAQALIDKGLIDYGWTYINVDDGWQAAQRNSDGHLPPNNKFPNMKLLGDWLHSKGLKFGIYSSPGERTCGGFLGSYKHEQQDADMWAGWGVDYLKHDWCSYSDNVVNDTTQAAYIKPFRVMQQALQTHKRDIFYNLCQYGLKKVEQWGTQVGAQSWRTTEDIEDTWESLYSIGFQQNSYAKYAKPGNWNDPDMMIVGNVGWGENLHPSRLTPDEQYTHVSLWSLLSAPLLIGCDLSKLDAFTFNLLANSEVIAINQDVLGRQATQAVKTPVLQVWIKELEDGSKAVGIFNMDSTYQNVTVNWNELGFEKIVSVRDVWRQKNTPKFVKEFKGALEPHGSVLFKIAP